MKLFKELYIYAGFLLILGHGRVEAQIDTAATVLQARQSALSSIRSASVQSMVVAQALATTAPSASYGSARVFAVNEEVNWGPAVSGGAAEFVVSVDETLSGYYNPLNTAVSSDNSLYTANAGYHSIMKRTSGGAQSVFAGGNSTAYGYVDGTGSTARFRHPSFLAFDASGNLFVSDQQNHRIRKITPSGVVSTFAGSGTAGSANGTGTSASFQYPMGLAFDGSGNLYVADAYNHRIRKITPTGVVSTYAGSGSAGLGDGALLTATFNYPIGLCFDGNGDLYVADRSNFAVRKISGGTVTTVAGNGTTGNVDGTGAGARFQANNLIVDGGNIYFVDQTYGAVKHISPSGQVVTISASGQFSSPFGISRGSDGKFYITENSNNNIKKVSILPAYNISPALPVGLLFDRYTGRISGKLTSVRSSQTYTVTVRNNVGSSTTTLTFSVGAGGGPTLSADQNYIVTRIPRRAYVATASLNAKPVDSVNVDIQYFDGLGRPLQGRQWQGSPLKNDIVQHIEYDGYGRESIRYLPHVKNTIKDGSFKTTAKSDQLAYYAASNTWDAAVVKTPNPYSVTVFENSPLNRVQQQGAPGVAWQPSSNRNTIATGTNAGRTVATDFGTNGTNDVRLWTLNTTGIGATATFYAAGKLHKTVIRDENWINTAAVGAAPSKTGSVEEFKDFEDRVVLKRVWETETKALNTYYVYDDFGDLRYVIPPGFPAATVTLSEAATGDFHELVYAYKYDDRRRLIEKKIPGKGWEYLVYNKSDQVVLTQDAVQRSAKKWSYTKYDPFGNIASTGIYTNSTTNQTTRAQVQALADAVTDQSESRVGTAAYTNVSFPNIASQLLELTVNYYDDYKFKTATVLPATAGIDSTWMVKGLLTGTRISKDDGTAPLLSVNYYDKYGRVIESVSDNHLAGVDRITNTYNFSGQLETSKRQHRISGSTAVTTILTTNVYDHVGRLVETKKKIGSQAEVLQSRLAYNEIGQRKTKSLHSENGGSNFMTSIAYAYNERGWQTRASAPQFTSQLNYNMNGTTVLTNAQYNGNIAQQLWGHAATTNSTFTYGYDALNRLKSGVSTGTVMNESLTYDDMGNIRTLTRDNGTVITYAYNNSNKSNRLASLSGGLTGSFTYDVNGNATKDRTGMVFTYNQLNLPKTATGNSKTVAYTYDALGSKLNRKSTVGGIEIQQDYIGGIEYSRSGGASPVIERIATEDGFLLNSSGTYSYYYNVTDHLGNVRSVLKKTGTATAPTATVMQKQDYYPFGKTKSIATSIDNKYLYNGKEMQADLNGGTHTLGSSYVLEGQLDYGARFYDAEIGRWNVVDPLAEMHYNLNGYNYVMNNPIIFKDLFGLDTVSVNNLNIKNYKEDVDVVKMEEAVVTRTSYSNSRNFRLSYAISRNVDKLDMKGVIVDSDWQSVKHYYIGNGQPATIGKKSLKKVLLSPVFIELHKQISKGRFKTNTGINFTKHQFHIGRTTVNIFADPFKREVTYTLFEGDGFWDPDFIDEKYYKGPQAVPDGKGSNLERGGVPYDYNPTIITIPFY